jgi:hypothetical protein
MFRDIGLPELPPRKRQRLNDVEGTESDSELSQPLKSTEHASDEEHHKENAGPEANRHSPSSSRSSSKSKQAPPQSSTQQLMSIRAILNPTDDLSQKDDDSSSEPVRKTAAVNSKNLNSSRSVLSQPVLPSFSFFVSLFIIINCFIPLLTSLPKVELPPPTVLSYCRSLMHNLSLSTTPRTLGPRTKHYDDMVDRIQACIDQRSSSAFYIAGTPGTGAICFVETDDFLTPAHFSFFSLQSIIR